MLHPAATDLFRILACPQPSFTQEGILDSPHISSTNDLIGLLALRAPPTLCPISTFLAPVCKSDRHFLFTLHELCSS